MWGVPQRDPAPRRGDIVNRLDPAAVATTVFWSHRPGDATRNDVVARRDARVLRIVRRLTRRQGFATRAEISAAAMVDRRSWNSATADSVGCLNRLARQRLIVELPLLKHYYVAENEPLVAAVRCCPNCGAAL